MTTATLALSLPASIRLGVRHGLSAILRPLHRSTAIAQLDSLDDRLLRDIGLSRMDVDDMRRMW